jgi:hypothetical protein
VAAGVLVQRHDSGPVYRLRVSRRESMGANQQQGQQLPEARGFQSAEGATEVPGSGRWTVWGLCAAACWSAGVCSQHLLDPRLWTARARASVRPESAAAGVQMLRCTLTGRLFEAGAITQRATWGRGSALGTPPAPSAHSLCTEHGGGGCSRQLQGLVPYPPPPRHVHCSPSLRRPILP